MLEIIGYLLCVGLFARGLAFIAEASRRKDRRADGADFSDDKWQEDEGKALWSDIEWEQRGLMPMQVAGWLCLISAPIFAVMINGQAETARSVLPY